MKKKLLAGLVTGTIVIAGVVFGISMTIKDTPPEIPTQSVSPSSSSTVQVDNTNSGLSVSDSQKVDVNQLDADEAKEIVEAQGANGQGEGESLEDEIESTPEEPEGEPETPNQTEETPNTTRQIGDTYINEAGIETTIVDGNEYFGELTEEEIEYLRSLDLHFN